MIPLIVHLCHIHLTLAKVICLICHIITRRIGAIGKMQVYFYLALRDLMLSIMAVLKTCQINLYGYLTSSTMLHVPP